MSDADFALGFSNFSVISISEDKYLLHKVSGVLKYGCITAVMGPSAAGKSVLLQALSGRMQDVTISGDVFIDGSKVDPKRSDNPVAYVPQQDSVIGELTAREMTKTTALLKLNDHPKVMDESVSKILFDLGISEVADGIIGTLVFRGLSGGQKKRAEISTELIATPAILFLDEPTSGLDSSISLEVLTTVRNLVKNSMGKLSVILSIHQPNYRILELFDQLLLLDRGTSIFFGTIPESIVYFSHIGFPCPNDVTPTDYFLLISNSSFAYLPEDFDFQKSFTNSDTNKTLQDSLELIKVSSKIPRTTRSKSSQSLNTVVPFYRQLYILIYRDFSLAYRDPTLYYFQMAMLLVFGLFIGAVFFQLPHRVDEDMGNVMSGLIWLVFLGSWIHIFKVYHISQNDRRARHEIANNKYSIFCYFCADTVSSAVLMLLMTLVLPVVYFMMGFPASAFPFVILLFWVICLTSEAMLSFVTKFSQNPTVSMVQCQLVLLVTLIFAGGLFIPWKDCPNYWIWLQEGTMLTQASRSLFLEVLNHVRFECNLNSYGLCFHPVTYDRFPCDAYFANNQKCYVLAREVIQVTQGVSVDDDYWKYFGYLICIYLSFKLLILLLLHYPWDRILFKLKTLRTSAHQLPPPPNTMTKANKSLKTVLTPKAEIVCSFDENAWVTVKSESKMNGNASSTSALCWKNISVILPKTGTTLVDDVSGVVASGRVVALMGPSGAGKTTLLNALAGRAPYAKVTGDVLYCQRRMTSADLTYIPQFDEVNGMLTVLEHLTLVGSLTSCDSKACQGRVAMLLEVLGLETKKHCLVRGLTGGEVKRVSVGIGMMSAPNVLFLDEPTTGLDSTAAYNIVKYLVVVAKSTGVAVILTIHQPSAPVFNMLDDLLLLERGRVVYGGSIDNSKKYFSSLGLTNPEHINYADYYLDLVQSPILNSTKSWNEHFIASDYYTSLTLAITRSSSGGAAVKASPAAPSMVTRLWMMVTYFMIYFYRERGFYGYRLLVLIAAGLFGGTIFLNLQPNTDSVSSYAGAIMYSCISVMLSAVAPTGLFAKDRREAVDRVRNGIFSPGIFVLSQTLSSGVYNLVITFIYTCLYHWLVNLNPDTESFIYNILILWCLSMLQETMLMCCIEILKNDFLCTTAGMTLVAALLLGSGFYRRTEIMPVWIRWLSELVPTKWGFDGYTWQMFRSQEWEVVSTEPVQFLSGREVLGIAFHLTDTPSWGYFGLLLAYITFFRVVQYILFAMQTSSLPLLRKGEGGRGRWTFRKKANRVYAQNNSAADKVRLFDNGSIRAEV